MSRGVSRVLRRCNSGLIHALWLVAVSSCLFAQTDVTQKQKPGQAAAPRDLHNVQATRVDTAPKLDGTLDDPLWQQAKPITQLVLHAVIISNLHSWEASLSY